MQTETLLTCPHCGHSHRETLQEGVCVGRYRCEQCHQWVDTREGKCCVFCSYADTPCLQAQINGGSCCGLD